MSRYSGLNLRKLRTMLQGACKKPFTMNTKLKEDGSYSHQEIVVHEMTPELNLLMCKLHKLRDYKNTPKIEIYYDEVFNGTTYRHNILV